MLSCPGSQVTKGHFVQAPSHRVLDPKLLCLNSKQSRIILSQALCHHFLNPKASCFGPLGNLGSIPFCHVGPCNHVLGPKSLCLDPLTVNDYLSQALGHHVLGPKQPKVPLSWPLGHPFLDPGILGSTVVMGPKPHCLGPQATCPGCPTPHVCTSQ